MFKTIRQSYRAYLVMNLKLGFVVPIAFLLLQQAVCQNATETDDNDEGMDDFPGPPPFGERPPGPPPGGWRHGRHFGRGGPCGPPPPPPNINGTETEKTAVAKRSVRERRESEMTSEDTGSSGGNGGQGNGHQGGPPPQGGNGRGPPRGFVEKRSVKQRREVSEMNSEDTGSNGGNGGQGNGHQGGPPPQGGNGRGPPRGFVEKRLIRQRREDPQSNIPSEVYATMIQQQQENGHKLGLPQGIPPREFVNAKSPRHRRELSEMTEEDSAGGGGNGGQGNGQQGGPPPQGNGGRGRPRGFVEKRSIRERREDSQAESDSGTDGDATGQGQGNGGRGPPRQGGPPQGGGGRGPPRGFVGKRSIKERRDSLPMNGEDEEEMVLGMMGQVPEDGNTNDQSYNGGEGPPRSGRMRRCGGRRGRFRSTTTTTPATTTTTAAGKR